ncbi:Phage transcriptional regulator AlpA [Candidatus Terasakiella magnetica]|uniref:Phage transcriptional regulator AlpA n=1 Tax=Candidatus Terasakiella magnetica TaxID=1867952 RepID=A0A1C3RHJ2_9PROT|nr:AlpA family phage regulatory protein [Candidatus Terasakiella magnetica]SCA56739.1 Phage transcriptional regulator AlpA [Candidatus Terasakiella magnetica]
MSQFENRLVSKKELRSLCGIPYTPQHIARLEAAGNFPRRVNLGPNRVAWVLSEVNEWIQQRLNSRDTADDNSASS